MAEEFGFKDLKVWHKSVDFADKIIGIIDNLNSARKHFRLLEQIEAASTSISSNIAEGKGRFSKKEFRQYLYISRGSLYESISLLNICQRRNWISKTQLNEVESDGLEIAKMIKGLINSLEIN